MPRSKRSKSRSRSRSRGEIDPRNIIHMYRRNTRSKPKKPSMEEQLNMHHMDRDGYMATCPSCGSNNYLCTGTKDAWGNVIPDCHRDFIIEAERERNISMCQKIINSFKNCFKGKKRTRKKNHKKRNRFKRRKSKRKDNKYKKRRKRKTRNRGAKKK